MSVGMSKVWDLGEKGTIALLASIATDCGVAFREGLLFGIGDDAAAWRGEDGLVLGTIDTLTQDVHFTPDTAGWDEIGWKSMAVNISDIAAMGGIPDYALVSLGLSGDMEVADLAKFYGGLADAARRFKVAIAGGNLYRSLGLTATVSLLGRASEGGIMTRSSALPGDYIAVTGYLGSSAAGLKSLTGSLQSDADTAALIKEAHLRPHPRVDEGQALARCGVRTAIDLSDGLISDLGQVCRASEVGARILVDTLPVHPLVRKELADDLPGLALSGGEDYELLFTAKAQVIDRVMSLISVPVTVIGQVTGEAPGEIALIDSSGGLLKYEGSGWDHFGAG
ncbi:thiamine-phosphate kinase [Chloroflexota bacterium]